MAQFKLFGGPHHGKIVQIDNVFIIECWIVPRVGKAGFPVIEYDRYTRRELDGIFYFAFDSVDDAEAQQLLRAA